MPTNKQLSGEGRSFFPSVEVLNNCTRPTLRSSRLRLLAPSLEILGPQLLPANLRL